jgi:hypothetical protein
MPEQSKRSHRRYKFNSPRNWGDHRGDNFVCWAFIGIRAIAAGVPKPGRTHPDAGEGTT